MIQLKSNSGLIKEVPIGFSWTVLLFGGFVPLFRGDIKWFFIMLLTSLLTYGIALLVFPFIYNKIYINDLTANKGFRPANSKAKQMLKEIGINFETLEN